MADPITIRARRLFVASKTWGYVVERAALRGAYDEGSYIRDFMPQAEREILKERPENVEG